jgi:hypothetical protein
MKAENSTSLNLCVAMARPSQGGGGGACPGEASRPMSAAEDTAVAGLPAELTPYGDCANGFTL